MCLRVMHISTVIHKERKKKKKKQKKEKGKKLTTANRFIFYTLKKLKNGLDKPDHLKFTKKHKTNNIYDTLRLH
jgi:DNA-nicking Smr family endonuclease